MYPVTTLDGLLIKYGLHNGLVCFLQATEAKAGY